MKTIDREAMKVENLDTRAIAEVMHEYAEVTGAELLSHWEDDSIPCATARISLSDFTLFNIELMWIGWEGLGALEYAGESQKAREFVLEMLRDQIRSYNNEHRRRRLAGMIEEVCECEGLTKEIDQAISGLLHAVAKELLGEAAVPTGIADSALYVMITKWREEASL